MECTGAGFVQAKTSKNEEKRKEKYMTDSYFALSCFPSKEMMSLLARHVMQVIRLVWDASSLACSRE